MFTDTLVIIPARGGSKGIPDKNVKELGGKPLIQYSVAVARAHFPDDNICVSTDSERIKAVAEELDLSVPFLRPAHLATDTASTYEVLLHALNYYETRSRHFEKILLLQPTSPFREERHLEEAITCYNHNEVDMIVSVGVAHHNPYFSLFEENADGYLTKSKASDSQRRQDIPPVYYYNGSIYVINVATLRQKPLHQFERIKKYIMDEKYCFDIDTPMDWLICEALLEKGIYKNANH